MSRFIPFPEKPWSITINGGKDKEQVVLLLAMTRKETSDGKI
jgi:hypothetical protein